MPERVSHSLLDPLVTEPLRRLYPRLRLPRRLPPEAIVLTGNACGWAAAAGLSGWIAAAAIGLIMAGSVLENLKAKLGANFEVRRFGPTELKAAIVLLLASSAAAPPEWTAAGLRWCFLSATVAAAAALPFQVAAGVRAVNASAIAADTSPWRRAA